MSLAKTKKNRPNTKKTRRQAKEPWNKGVKGYETTIRKGDAFKAFIEWSVLTADERKAKSLAPDQQTFAREWGVDEATLSTWKHRDDFAKGRADAFQMKLAASTPEVMAGLLSRATRGYAFEVEIWLAFVEKWDKKKILEVKPSLDFGDTDIRTLIGKLPPEKQKEYYGTLASLIADAQSAAGNKPLEKALEQLAYSREQMLAVYADRPLTFLRTFDTKTKWPKRLREIFAEIWLGKAGPNIIIKAPRGGGKSRLLGSLGFCLWFFRNLSIVDMGGALAQAKVVYNYFTSIIFSNHRIQDSLPEEPMMERSEGAEGNYFMCVAASPKAVRGPHPDVLMADEVCETPDELVDSALPMVDTSATPFRILTSTFHKVFGIFQEIWDRADELGYTRFSWDVFDVTKTFDPAIFDDPELNRLIPDLKDLKKLANGKTGDPEGWVPIKNVINAWRGKRSLSWFLTEYMGSRPGVEGLVNDPEDVEKATFDPEVRQDYAWREGAEVFAGIDWGFSTMTSWVEFMLHADGVVVQLDNENYTQTRSEVIIEDAVRKVKAHGITRIYCDSAGKFENAALKNALDKERLRCEVIEVVFSVEKDENLGNYRAYFQRGMIKIPKTAKVALWQHKRYRFAKGSNRPLKKDDHIPDATACCLSGWKLGEETSSIGDLHEAEGDDNKPIMSGVWNKRF